MELKVIDNIWHRSILALFKNEELKEAVENWVEDNDCEIVWIELDASEDLVAVGGFAAIIDRTIISKNAYQAYLDYREEACAVREDPKRDETISMLSDLIGFGQDNCIIFIDEKKDLALPLADIVLQVDINRPGANEYILQNISLAQNNIHGDGNIMRTH